jgi:hypothetical protein
VSSERYSLLFGQVAGYRATKNAIIEIKGANYTILDARILRKVGGVGFRPAKLSKTDFGFPNQCPKIVSGF